MVNTPPPTPTAPLQDDQTFQQAISAHRAGQLREAHRLYRLILQAQPNHPDAHHNLGALALQHGRAAIGLPHFQAAWQARPDYPQYWLSYANALIEAEQFDTARQLLAHPIPPAVPNDAVQALARRLSALPGDTLRSSEPALDGLMLQFKQGRYAEVVQRARDLTVPHPQNGMGWKLLAAALSRLGHHEDALEPMLRVADLFPNDKEAHNNLGVTLSALGRHSEAQASFRQALQIAPGYAQAHYNLGNTLQAQGELSAAVAEYEQAHNLKPHHAPIHIGLANALKDLGRFAEAESAYRQALQLDPGLIEPCCNLGVVLHLQGRLDEAQASYRRTLQLDPACGPAYNNLGNTLQIQGKLAEAEANYRQALRVAPDYAEACNNLGSTLQSMGRFSEAEQYCRRALQLRKDYPEAYSNLGNTLWCLGRLDEAQASCLAALKLSPTFPEAHNNLGNVMLAQYRLTDAGTSYHAATQLKPDYAQAHSNLAVALAYLSDFSEVVSASNRALELQPNDESIWEQRLYNLSYHPDLSAANIYAEFVRWGDRFPDPVLDFSAHDRTRGRRLRIGYVSPDFRRHTSRFFFWPLFANHDQAVVELVAYSNVAVEDDVTQDFKGLFAHWRNIRGVSDQDVADLVQRDRIDILVDCCNHMRDARLGVFALKPAPIQATWLGAAWTTGLKAVDYALIDPYMAPEGTLTRETIVRLPHCFVAYRPPEPTPEVAPAPCLENGFITFGYSGRSERLNHHTFRVWGEILRQNPSARLILDFRSFADPATQAHYRQFMTRQGMDASRVTMRNSANIFEGLKDFDILLDCFPHSGGTMLFDALWMGVPVLTLASRPPVGRIGTSLMMNLELPQWVAHSHADYIAKALSLAQDMQALSELRGTMRARLQRSPIMDGIGFARGVEAAYRRMFQAWSKG